MEAINVEAEYRKAEPTTGIPVEVFAAGMVRTGQWVEDDGEFFDADDWYAEEEKQAAAERGVASVTHEVRALADMAKRMRRGGEAGSASIIYAALRSLDIEPDTL